MDTREKKTAHELADMVANGIGVGDVAVVVHKDPAYGWHPIKQQLEGITRGRGRALPQRPVFASSHPG
jgi:hypothetical protein